jgi:hypothetical protein
VNGAANSTNSTGLDNPNTLDEGEPAVDPACLAFQVIDGGEHRRYTIEGVGAVEISITP